MLITAYEKKRIYSSKDIAAMMAKILRSEDPLDRDKEHCWAIGLTTRNTIKYIELVHLGSINKSIISPAAVFRRAVKDAVSSVVIVHNHPSNETDPSPEDTHITMTLKKAGEILEITLLDHIIIGKNNTHFSFSDEGML